MSNSTNYFAMEEELNEFEMWQGLRGPYYTPSVSPDGELSWTNNGSLPNPAPVDLTGPAGKSAYEAAREGGYQGTEAEFNEALAEIDTALQPSDVDSQLSGTSENPVQNKVIYNALQNIHIDVDDELSDSSENPVQNKVITQELADQKSVLSDLENNSPVDVFSGASWEIGSISATGGNSSNTKRIRTVDYIPADFVSVKFTISTGYRFGVAWYASDKSFLRFDYWYTENLDIIPPEGTAFLRALVSKVPEETASLDYANEISASGFNNLLLTVENLNSGLDEERENTAPLFIGVGAIFDNEYARILPSGIVATTTNAIGTSRKIFCKPGESFTYNLSTQSNYLVFAVYDKYDNLTHSVTGNGYSNYLSGSYTFQNGDTYFRYSGVLAYPQLGMYIAKYSAKIHGLDELTNALPDVWNTYLNQKIPEIKSALVAIGDSGESFTFVTDVHVPSNNMLTPKILKRLEAVCPVNYHINGGDFLNIDTTSAQSALDTLWQWRDAMAGIEEFCARGNHDNNNFNSSNPDNVLTSAQFYAVFDRPIENRVNTDGKTYYCIDNQSQKIRIIVLDSSLDDKAAMYTWFQSRLTELASAWTILVVQHYLWGSDISQFSPAGEATINQINSVYSQINAALIGILAGHTHVDNNAKESVNGYNLIARDTNKIQSGNGLDTDSLSFDYVTINKTDRTINFVKIGRGNNLSLSY